MPACSLSGLPPEAGEARVQGDSLAVLGIDSIATLESDTVFTTGLTSTKAPADETALKGSLASAVVTESAAIAPVSGGYDFEALRILPNGNFMASDELGPALVEIDGKTKRILREWWPGKGLSPVFSNRRNNRGFEAMAVTPSGVVVAMLQSAADNPSKSDTKESRAIRILRFDPTTETSKDFGFNLSDLSYSAGTQGFGGEDRATRGLLGKPVSRRWSTAKTVAEYSIDLVEFDLPRPPTSSICPRATRARLFPWDNI
ncbi:MAG: esterase-like activity of phytase family protein [Fibrobacteres bacterium]|nr:esterase-like activity of phytase family protein [Fibrobacterota bacterium]